MTEYKQVVTLAPVPAIYARVYRARGLTVPAQSTPHYWGSLIPLSWRWLHQAYAQQHGYFWLPCPLCRHYFGGHEITASIPDPPRGPGAGLMICGDCTILHARRGR